MKNGEVKNILKDIFKAKKAKKRKICGLDALIFTIKTKTHWILRKKKKQLNRRSDSKPQDKYWFCGIIKRLGD